MDGKIKRFYHPYFIVCFVSIYGFNIIVLLKEYIITIEGNL